MKIKKNSILLLAISLLLVVSCSNDTKSETKVISDSTQQVDNTPGELLNQRSFEITTGGDTINVKDENGLKQGIWVTNTGVLLANGGVKKDTVYYKDNQPQKK
jgi:hypothetical protein